MNDDMLFLKMAREDALKAELAALREELAMWKGRTTNVCMKLTAAEQRNATLTTLLREGLEEYKNGDDWVDRVIEALRSQPAESGASE